MKLPALALTLACLSLAGCKPDAAIRKGEVIGDGAKNPGQPAETSTPRVPVTGPTGSIAGTITYNGAAPTASIDTSMDPACAMGGGSDRLPVEQIAVKNGKLANVFVYVKSGPPQAMNAAPSSTQPVVMDQQHCRYVPHVIGVLAGGTVEFRNSDPTMHNIHTTSVDNQPIDVSQSPRGAPIRKQFAHPEILLPVRCNNHPWMNAFLNVSATPFFAVSDASGHFEIAGLPPGDYVLGLAQEKLGEKTLPITVQPGKAAKADLSYAK